MIWWSTYATHFEFICFSVLYILGLALTLSDFLFYAWTISISVFLPVMLIFLNVFFQNEIWEQHWHDYGCTNWQKLVSSNFLPTTCNHTPEMHHDFETRIRTTSIIKPLMTSYSIAMFASLFTVSPLFSPKKIAFLRYVTY